MTIATLALTGVSCWSQEQTEPRTISAWQAMARADLDAAHSLIRSSHPGAIDSENPDFKGWMETGYTQALTLIPHVISYDTAMSAVRFYTTGFLDGHLKYSDTVRKDDYPVFVDGWMVKEEKGKYIVEATLDKWSVALPPVGAELLGCDHRTPEVIVRDDVAPFTDRRSDPVARKAWASGLWMLHPNGSELRQCRFRETDGKELQLSVAYQPISMTQFFAALPDVHDDSTRVSNTYVLQDGVLWVHAANFNLRTSTSDAPDLEKMLKSLSSLTGVTEIVLDVRDNNGGDSSVGDRIFEAATGGLEYDTTNMNQLPHVYAQWRVSDLLLQMASDQLKRVKNLYGKTSERAGEETQFLNSIKAANAAGQPWVEQDGGYRLTQANIHARHGKLRRFDGKIVLLTDERCASACLDFADEIRQVPGAIHMGQSTSSDTVYMDVGSTALPSGNYLKIPMKVWRNRLRGNGESLKPDIPLDVDMRDDAAVRRAVLAALTVH